MNNSNADAIYHNMCAVNAYSALLKAFMIVCIIDCTKIKVGILLSHVWDESERPCNV